ncbi:nSTAND3 domain-containing NTPase [Clostridium chauvoei]|uniref:nSTAND3 domain-containing NTPase n=1 Tax=Clostridium chauvoei TaxID=46867 RepID=UPI001C84A8CB|nr:restriction endonuclease [Clostridium chauvoei]MBX7379820.1 restriction endonuclease [Clostridium chauvoei]
MANYDFKELSSYDFELLIRDILQKELGVYIESFKSGRDNGIDLRYSTDKKNTAIIQCKHYANSSFSNLKTSLKGEVLKLNKIKCRRYMVITSKGLNPMEKDELLEILRPYCDKTSDILGKEDINNLLTKYPEVEKSNYKLWLTSTTLMDKILHSRVYNQSELEIDDIRSRCKYYVQNKSFFIALDMLKELNYCIITGMPGIGKTTLAEILILHFLEKEYDIYKISNDISEAYEVYNKNKKQLFYYDDFLGQTSLDNKLNKNEDDKILKFIKTIAKNKNSKFILTTREYILNEAKIYYEKFNNFNFDINQCSIKLSDYTEIHKANILYNHLYFSELPREIYEQLIIRKKYKEIINHSNYNPRIIDEVIKNYCDESYDEFYKNMISTLDNPEYLWEHIFKNQLKSYSRNLLIILATMPNVVESSELKIAFESYNSYICDRYSENRHRYDFQNALKALEVTFIKVDKNKDKLLISFSNPSIKGFIENIIYDDKETYSGCLESTAFFMQIRTLASRGFKKFKDEKLISILINKIEETIEEKDITIFNKQNNSIVNYNNYTLLDKYNYTYEFLKLNNIEDTKLLSELLNVVIDKLTFDDLEVCLRMLRLFKKYDMDRKNYNRIGSIVLTIIIEATTDDILSFEWERVINILKEIEGNIRNYEVELITERYINNYETMLYDESSNLDNSDDVNETISIIEEINKYFGFDDEIDLLKNKFNELLEDELKMEYYDEDQAYEQYRDSKILNEDINIIDNMFESLLK